MTKHVDPNKPKQIIVVAAPQVPAQQEPPQVPALPDPLNGWELFTCLMEDMEFIKEVYDEICNLSMYRRERGEEPPDICEARLSEYWKARIPLCRQWLKELDQPDYYKHREHDDKLDKPILRMEIISQRLAMTFIAARIGGPETEDKADVFVKMLLEHVHDAHVSYLALESACRQIEQKEKYMRTISEVLGVLKEHDKKWRGWKWALEDIEQRSNDAQARIQGMWIRYEAERVREEAEQARKQAAKRLNEANYRLARAEGALKLRAEAVDDAQKRHHQAYEDVQKNLPLLVECQQEFDAAIAELDAGIAAAKAAGLSDDKMIQCWTAVSTRRIGQQRLQDAAAKAAEERPGANDQNGQQMAIKEG